MRPLRVAGGVGGLGHALGHVLGQVADPAVGVGVPARQALDVDLIAEAGATFPRSQPNRLDRQALDLASGRR